MAYSNMSVYYIPSKEKRNREPDILKALLLNSWISTRDIARYAYEDDIRKYNKFYKNYETRVSKALDRLASKGLVKSKIVENVKTKPARYYSLTFKGSIIALKYNLKRIASKEALKDKKVTEEFKECIRENFYIKLKDPYINKDGRIIIISDISDNNIKIVIDKNIGIVMYYNIISLFFIRNDGIYVNAIGSEEVFNINEDDKHLLEKLKRYLVKTYGRLGLGNASLKREEDKIIIYSKSKKRGEKELVTLYIKDNYVTISINDNRYNYKKSPKLYIINNRAYETSITSNYYSE